ncbi:hypothetical protein H6F96_09080 [Microcoleus sp. FACHB-53]|nr:hypothetical protein [Microcoleus sp. FACHB-53]
MHQLLRDCNPCQWGTIQSKICLYASYREFLDNRELHLEDIYKSLQPSAFSFFGA